MKSIPKLLSKTKLLRGYRCLKCIYLTVHHPTLEAPIDDNTQALFDQGNAVGVKAREYYPGGVLVDNQPWDFTGALQKTQELITNGVTTLYEAAFEYKGCYARADIIQYSKKSNRWRIIEVKSTTKIKPEHYDDIGLQAWIITKSGLPIEQINLVHLNTQCCYPDLHDLFTEVDVTEDIRQRYLTIQPTLYEIITTLKQPTVPDIDIGPYCLAPTECGFTEHCWQEKKIPDMSVFNLPGMRDKKWQLYQAGIVLLDDPRLTDLTDLQARIVNCFKTNTRYIDKPAIQSALSGWQFPLVFLDFETINPAIPRFDGCHPYDHVPFQFSVHRMESPDSTITHQAFLHDNASDPRPALIPALLNACGQQGSIVAYFARFEADRITALAEYSNNHREPLLLLLDRLVDPLPIIREAVYDNDFAGSFSLKQVGPAILGDAYRYDDMLVANGSAAQRAFEMLIADSTAKQKKQQIKEAMLEYCKKDTEVMVELVKWLYTV